MGKRNLKNKYKKFNTEKNENRLEEEDNFQNEITEAYIILQKLTSDNYNDREHITSLLASHEFSGTEMRDQILNIGFIKVLIDKLLDPFIQVRFNSISAIINLILCYSDYDIDLAFLINGNLLGKIEEMFQEYASNAKQDTIYSESEIIKINKTLKSCMDLLLLIIELYDESRGYSKLNFENILNFIIELILSPGSLNEEFIISSCLFVTNLLATRVICIKDSQTLNSFVQFSVKILKEGQGKANECILTCFTCSLFYLYCCNPDYFNQEEILQSLIERIYTNINFNIPQEIDELNSIIQNLTKVLSSMDVDENSSNSNGDNTLSELKGKVKSSECKIRSCLVNLKTFTDIIECIDFPNTNKKSQMIEDEEEYEDDEIGDNLSSIKPGSINPEIEDKISQCLSSLFTKSGYAPVQKMLSLEFMTNLSKLFSNLSVEEFLINDFDKMIAIKELLYDLEFVTLSLFNNITQKFDGILNESTVELTKNMLKTITERLNNEEYSKNQDFISVLLLSLRTLLEKNKGLSYIHDLSFVDFKSLLVILNNNINDNFIKMNVIDIISLVFSFPGHSMSDNLEVCKLLHSIFFKESDMEVIGHVINAFFDIYKDEEYNQNLKAVGIIDLMKSGATEFKSRVTSTLIP